MLDNMKPRTRGRRRLGLGLNLTIQAQSPMISYPTTTQPTLCYPHPYVWRDDWTWDLSALISISWFVRMGNLEPQIARRVMHVSYCWQGHHHIDYMVVKSLEWVLHWLARNTRCKYIFETNFGPITTKSWGCLFKTILCKVQTNMVCILDNGSMSLPKSIRRVLISTECWHALTYGQVLDHGPS